MPVPIVYRYENAVEVINSNVQWMCFACLYIYVRLCCGRLEPRHHFACGHILCILFVGCTIFLDSVVQKKKRKKIWNRMTASVLKQDPNTKRFKQTLIYFNMDMVCKFSGKSPLSSHKTTLKQQINGQKQWGKNHLSCFGLVFTVCSVLKDSSKQDVFFFHFSLFLAVYLLFCGLIKGTSPKICILCVCVK